MNRRNGSLVKWMGMCLVMAAMAWSSVSAFAAPGFNEYRFRYDHIRMDRENGILTMTIQNTRLPIYWGSETLYEFASAFWDIACDSGNEMVILSMEPNTLSMASEEPSTAVNSGFEMWDDSSFLTKRMLSNLLDIRVPVIGVLNGLVENHGELILLSDIVLAEENAVVSERAFLSGGTGPSEASYQTWLSLLGANRGRRFLLTGESYSAQMLAEMGVVSEVLSEGELMEKARRLASSIRSRPRSARRYMRYLFTRDFRKQLPEGPELGLFYKPYSEGTTTSYQWEEAESENPQTLPIVWLVPRLRNPYSVVYDPSKNVLYVSSVYGDPGDKDGKGFISQISIDGRIDQLYWISGLNAPKGMAVHRNRLYAADIDRLVEIDIPGRTVVDTYSMRGVEYLTDVAVAEDGAVYVTDMMGNAVYRLHDGRFEQWIRDDELEIPDSLIAEKNRLVVASWGEITGPDFQTDIPGHVKTISYKDQTIQSMGNGYPIGNIGGISAVGRGNYLVTDRLAGKLFLISPKGEATFLQDLKPGAGDPEYIPSERLVVIPLAEHDQLIALKM